tara:strand:+ start:4739 stop:5347 length:609 start_codon:yes stop_codon:yes gene_type:complete
MQPHIDPSADVDPTAAIGNNSTVWHLSQVREKAEIGNNCVIGRGAYIGPGVKIGSNTKIQNLAQIYDPAEISEGVFIGPGAILTNDVYPRAISSDGKLKEGSDWVPKGVTIKSGASIGARSVILAGVTIGKWALIGAGTVVIRDIPDHALVAGNPSRQIGWVGRAGIQLVSDGNLLICPETGEKYIDIDGGIEKTDDNPDRF